MKHQTPKPGVKESEIISLVVNHESFPDNNAINQYTPVEKSVFGKSVMTGNRFADQHFLTISEDVDSDLSPFIDVVRINENDHLVSDFFDKVSEYLDSESAHPTANKIIFNYLTIYDFGNPQLAKALLEKTVQQLQKNVDTYGADQVAEYRDEDFIDSLAVERAHTVFDPTHFYSEHLRDINHNYKNNLFKHIVSDLDHDRVRAFITNIETGLKLTIPEVERYHINNAILTRMNQEPDTHTESIIQTGKGVGLDDDDFYEYIRESRLSEIKAVIKDKVNIFNDACTSIVRNTSLNDVTLYDLLRLSRDSLDKQDIKHAVDFSLMQLGFKETITQLSDYIIDSFANNRIYNSTNVENPTKNLVIALLFLEKENPGHEPFMPDVIERINDRVRDVRQEMEAEYDPDDENEPFYAISSMLRKFVLLTERPELTTLEPETGWALKLDEAISEANKLRTEFQTYQSEIKPVSGDLIEVQVTLMAKREESVLKEKPFDLDNVGHNTL